MKNLSRVILVVYLSLFTSQLLAQEPFGVVLSEGKISGTAGGFVGLLADGDQFGSGVAELGDLDHDNVIDIAVGASTSDDGGPGRGAVWILFLNADGTVKAHQKISNTSGGFYGLLDDHDSFGLSVESLGDLDDDGVTDLAVSALQDDDGGADRGAVWVLFLNANGTVKTHQKISHLSGGPERPVLGNGNEFGTDLGLLGDIDGDGTVDIAVGAHGSDDGGTNRGAAWILRLNHDGTVKASQKISQGSGGFQGTLDNSDLFGNSLTELGDLDRDGVTDLAVGAALDDDGATNAGAIYILFLNSNGTVKAQQKISALEDGFGGTLREGDIFRPEGTVADLDGDGVNELIAGATGDDDGGTNRGAVWILFLNPTGTVRAYQKISATEGGFVGPLADGDTFGSAATGSHGDFNGDGFPDIFVTAQLADDGGNDRGAVWLLSLKGATPTERVQTIIDAVQGLVASGDLSEGIGTSLLSKLQNALNTIALDRPNAANLLRAFLNEVTALISGGVLSPAVGEPLRDAAMAVIAQL